MTSPLIIIYTTKGSYCNGDEITRTTGWYVPPVGSYVRFESLGGNGAPFKVLSHEYLVENNTIYVETDKERFN